MRKKFAFFRCNSMSLRKSYLFLIILAFFLSGLSFLLATEYKMEWYSAFISNTATGIVASLVIIFLIDKIYTICFNV